MKAQGNALGQRRILQMEVLLTEWDSAFAFFIYLGVTFVFSFLARITLFKELDYYEIKYTQQTKKRTLWLIYFNLLAVSLWLHILQRLLSRL
jgi:hypothetical protein